MDERDMGPFAGMDPALVRAITNYGSSPYRQTVAVTVRDVSPYQFDDLPETVEAWIGWMEAARHETPEEYRATLKCVLSYERAGWDEGDSASLRAWYERRETDAEMEARIGDAVAYIRSQEERERREFERLSAKFKP